VYSKPIYIAGGKTLAAIQTMIDHAIADNTVLVLEWEGAWDAGIFQSVVNYIVARKNQIYNITVDDYYKLTLGPVRVPRIT
jgi:hypothetical protein